MNREWWDEGATPFPPTPHHLGGKDRIVREKLREIYYEQGPDVQEEIVAALRYARFEGRQAQPSNGLFEREHRPPDEGEDAYVPTRGEMLVLMLGHGERRLGNKWYWKAFCGAHPEFARRMAKGPVRDPGPVKRQRKPAREDGQDRPCAAAPQKRPLDADDSDGEMDGDSGPARRGEFAKAHPEGNAPASQMAGGIADGVPGRRDAACQTDAGLMATDARFPDLVRKHVDECLGLLLPTAVSSSVLSILPLAVDKHMLQVRHDLEQLTHATVDERIDALRRELLAAVDDKTAAARDVGPLAHEVARLRSQVISKLEADVEAAQARLFDLRGGEA